MPGQAEPLQQGRHLGPATVQAAGQPQRQQDVLGHAELVDQAEVLGHHGHRVPGWRSPVRRRGPGEAPAVGPLPAAQQVQQGGLPGPGRADQGDQLAGLQDQVGMAQGQDLLGTAPVGLAQPGRLDHHLTDRGTPLGFPEPLRAHGGPIQTRPCSTPILARRSGNSPSASGGSWTRPASSITESASCLVASASIAPWRR